MSSITPGTPPLRPSAETGQNPDRASPRLSLCFDWEAGGQGDSLPDI